MKLTNMTVATISAAVIIVAALLVSFAGVGGTVIITVNHEIHQVK